MNQLVIFLYFGSGLLAFTFCQGDELPGDVNIKNCTDDNWLDIRENQNNTIVCEGFNDKATIVWFIQRSNESKRTPVATCGPSNCTVHQPEHFAVQRSPSLSLLFYQQYDRDLDGRAQVICESQLADNERRKGCTLNVINPATLSNCSVETNTKSCTATGSCRFEEVFSFSRLRTCTWYLEKGNHETRTVTGNIVFTGISSSEYKSGVCNFSTTLPTSDPATYSYSVSFYPGTGKVKVNTTNTGTHSTCTLATTTRDKTFSTLSTPIATDNGSVTSVQTKETDEKEEADDLPVAAIAGGAAAAVVVIIIVVVVFVVVRRRRRQTSDTSTHRSKSDGSTQDNDFEEHVNPMYITSEGQDDRPHPGHSKPSAVALRISSDTRQEPSTAPPSLHADLYSSVDGEDTHNPYSSADGRFGGYEDMGSHSLDTAETDDGYAAVDTPRSKLKPSGRFGGYEDIGFDGKQNLDTPETDDGYAAVDKPRSKLNPSSSASAVPSTHNNHEYAVVDKRRPRNAATNHASGPANVSAATGNGGTDVYAQVNKADKKPKVVSESQPQGDDSAQVQKPKPAAKPKISVKPSLQKEADYPSVADYDDYRSLNHSRGIPTTQSQANVDSHYSHIGQD